MNFSNGAIEDRWQALAPLLRADGEAVDFPRDTGTLLSAVLLLLYDVHGEPHVVFTRRTHLVAVHKGEISLPGGAYEADKDPSLVHTALREAAEEVGIDVAAVRVIGGLPLVHTMSSNFLIAPYLAIATERPRFRPDPIEVAEVLEVPLAALREQTRWRQEEREMNGVTEVVDFYAHDEHKIWGATARIVGEFLAILDKAPT